MVSEEISESVNPEEQTAIDLFSAARVSVVRITVHPGLAPGTDAHGTGFVWDGQGHFVTNHHVVERGEKFFVRVGTDRDVQVLEAKLVGSDPHRDIAVLKICEGKSPPSLKRSHAKLRVGQSVYVIGAPFGLSHTFTSGIISGLGREIAMPREMMPLFDVIQTGT